SHLLAEVEQSCTHLVVMDRGRLVQAGPVAEIIGSGDTLLVGLAADVPDPLVDKIAALPDVESVTRAEGGVLLRLASGDGPAARRRAPPTARPARPGAWWSSYDSKSPSPPSARTAAWKTPSSPGSAVPHEHARRARRGGLRLPRGPHTAPPGRAGPAAEAAPH